jgi:protein-disulfide isomerase
MKKHIKKHVKNNWWIILIILVVIIGGAKLLGGTNTADTSQVQFTPLFESADQIAQDDPARGEGKLTLVEFSDYECPFCAEFYRQVEIRLEEDFPDQIRFVYKDFPLDTACNEKLSRQIHNNACNAALAAECAKEQGMYWQYHDVLFQNRQKLSVSDLKNYASILGLDMTQFNECLDSQKYLEEVKEDIAQGQSLGVTGTPALIIGNKLIAGLYPYETYKALIEEALQG